MTRRCPNCDQQLLDDEQRCWQCGLQLEPLTETRAAVAETAAPDPEELSFTVYGALTIAVILAAFLLTLYLGDQPRLELSEANLPEDWIMTSDNERSFLVFLPEAWRTFQLPEDADRVPQSVVATGLYRQALLPLAGFVDDEQVMFLALSNEHSSFLLVARSAILSRLSPADVAQADLSLEGEELVTVLEARQLVSHGVAQAHLRVLHGSDETTGAVCRQRFVRGEQSSHLFALCAEGGALSDQVVEIILSSIQVLQQ